MLPIMDNKIPELDIVSYLFEKCSYDPDKPIIIDGDDTSKSLSWRQMRTLIRKLRAGFKSKRIGPGHCVCVHAKNDIYNFAVAYATIAVGAIYAATSYFLGPKDLATAMKTCEATHIFVDPEHACDVIEVAAEIGIPHENLFLTDQLAKSPVSLPSWRTLLEYGEADWLRVTKRGVLEEKVAMRFFTSGTTGAPKAAEISHYNLVAAQIIMSINFDKPYEERALYQVPMFHVSSSIMMNASYLHGVSAFLAKSREIEAIVSYIEKHKITDMFLNPTSIMNMLNTPSVTPDRLKTLRQLRCGGAPVPLELAHRFMKYLPPEGTMIQGYGMTELAGGFTSVHYPQQPEHNEVGYVLPHCSVKILDPEGDEILKPDIPGDILVQTPTMFKGYLNNPAANTEVFTDDGWLRTGDMGFFSSTTGMLTFAGRRKEAFKVSHEQVAPVEVENVLMRHPAIGDAVVYPVFDKYGVSASVHAKVVLRQGVNQLKPEELINFAKEQLSEYKLPTGGIDIVDAIPRNVIGKIDRAAVARMPSNIGAAA